MKREVLRDRKYLDWLKTQRCIISGLRADSEYSVDPAHIGTLGKGIKSPDNEALPLLHAYHQLAHSIGEMSVFRRHASDDLLRAALRAYAREMYAAYLEETGNQTPEPKAKPKARKAKPATGRKIRSAGFDKTRSVKLRTRAVVARGTAGHMA